MMLHIKMPQRGAKGGGHMGYVVITNGDKGFCWDTFF